MRRCTLVILLASLTPLLFITVVSHFIVEAQKFLPLPPLSHDQPSNYGLLSESVSFPSYSFTGNNETTQLTGWWIPSKSPEPKVTLVAVHGAGGDRRAFLRQSKGFHQSGYSVLLFDCQTSFRADYTEDEFLKQNPPRNQKNIKYGVLESDDVLSAVRYARKRSPLNTKIVVVGLSNGGASVIVAGSSPEAKSRTGDFTIDGVIAEAPFASPKSIIEYHLHKFFRGGRSGNYATFGKYGAKIAEFVLPNLIPDWLLTYTIEAALWRIGCLPERHFGSSVVKDLSPTPLFLLHGTGDPLVPASHSQILFDAAKEPKELWLVKDGLHRSGYDLVGPKEYHQRFDEFIKNKVTK